MMMEETTAVTTAAATSKNWRQITEQMVLMFTTQASLKHFLGRIITICASLPLENIFTDDFFTIALPWRSRTELKIEKRREQTWPKKEKKHTKKPTRFQETLVRAQCHGTLQKAATNSKRRIWSIDFNQYNSTLLSNSSPSFLNGDPFMCNQEGWTIVCSYFFQTLWYIFIYICIHI